MRVHVLDYANARYNKCNHNLPFCILQRNFSYAVLLLYFDLIDAFRSSLNLIGTLTLDIIYFM